MLCPAARQNLTCRCCAVHCRRDVGACPGGLTDASALPEHRPAQPLDEVTLPCWRPFISPASYACNRRACLPRRDAHGLGAHRASREGRLSLACWSCNRAGWESSRLHTANGGRLDVAADKRGTDDVKIRPNKNSSFVHTGVSTPTHQQHPWGPKGIIGPHHTPARS